MLVSTVTRMWSELHIKDTCCFKRQTEETGEESDALALVGSPEEGDPACSGLCVTISGKNRNYPNDLAGFIRDKEYIERLLELMGGCPKLPEAGALTADQIYAQVGR